jgi:LuxR family maltose regulon positive regulatory protein
MLIPSKLSRPVRLEHTVVRERLLAKLSGANNYRLVLITSLPGTVKQRSFLSGPRVKTILGGFRWTKATTSRSVLPAI